MKNINDISDKIQFSKILEYYENKWNLIAKHKYLSVNFIDRYFWQLKPFKIEKYQILNPYLLFKYQKAINWQLASRYQNIPQLLIKLNRFHVNWIFIAIFQKLSLQFIESEKQNLQLKYLLKNVRFSQNDIKIIQKIFQFN